jgi:hypothetical protein
MPLLLGLIWVSSAQTVGSVNEKSKRPESNWSRVNRAARNVKAGDRRAIQGLVDEVFLANGLDSHISASATSIKDRLIAAELDFHNGTSDGIDAEKVAVSVNQLVQRLKLPAYANTNAGEVKKVRVRMLTLYPDLVGRGSAARRNDSKPHFEDKMSPVEAFHVAVTLIQQKVFNPEFQLTTQELKEKSAQAGTAGQAKTKSVASLQNPSIGERTHEMVAAIRQGAAAMSFRDMLEQSEQSLDLLGIRR